ncbi:outer membrane protein assembly factor BamA [Qipengyuania sp. 6B39]|uniref:outer membrane protein assembly factor BamA n=1 Tax=Qipengyuania proteolytica TaxID=2867239 RepID=UPI001C8A4CFB|nr:outer membrane protein assembly factor BamA [Qipengyuania proteolytica]MBX7495710.1 outer membrane protein assembly factor BamA [Qipengyuania proteolytica]
MTEFAPAATRRNTSPARLAIGLLAGTMLAGMPQVALAQEAEAAQAATPAPAAQQETVQTIAVSGAQRLEPQTILSYIRLRPGDVWTQAVGDQVLKDLYATELFSNASVVNNGGNVVITIVENPVINRLILEGNKRIKNDKILPEIKLSPRQIFTRSKVRADVARIIELYKRQGRFAATVEPKMVQLSQNRVDIVFEINEGPKSKVRQINIIGNEQFSDGELRGEMLTKQARLTSFFSSNTSYDPDRLAFDQQKLRQFYLTEGYADFRVVSAVAELTPDKRDFIITYVVEEGERYKFGDVSVDSQIRDFDSEAMTRRLPMKGGDFYDAKLVEDTVEQLTELAGTFGYAFADVSPQFSRNPETLTMDVEFVLREAPRVYVERIDVNGNTLTQDKVLRREFRLAEGDAFNSLAVARSTARINSLGYFQENFEINQVEGSAPDRIVLEANVEEQATGQLQLSAGFSSLESFILAGSIQQRNFRGRGQTVGLSLNYSRYSKSAQVSFSEPYVFDRNISAGIDIYRRDFNSFNFRNNERNTTYQQATTGLSIRAGVPLTEYLSAIGSYTFNYDDVSLGDEFFDADGTCRATRYLCEAIGQRSSSILGLSLNYNSLDSRLRPTRGESVSWTTEVAGLGGSEKYVRMRTRMAKYWPLGGGFIFSLAGEGGWIRGFGGEEAPGVDEIRLTDRFFLGEPQMRGFDIRGIGPRIVRLDYVVDPDDTDGPRILTSLEDALANNQRRDDSIGGKAYYLGRAELEIPLGSGAREMGIRPSVWLDVGSLFSITRPVLIDQPNGRQVSIDGVLQYTGPLLDSDGNIRLDADGDPIIGRTPNATAPDGTPNDPEIDPFSYYREVLVGDSYSPRIAAGFGVNWNSPFGPFRIDVSQVIKKQPGDDTKTFSFNVGTQF